MRRFADATPSTRLWRPPRFVAVAGGDPPAFGAAGTQVQTTSSTMNVDVPDGVVADSYVVVTAFVDVSVTVTGMASGFANAGSSPITVVAPSGVHSLYVMGKRATGTESTGGTYSFTLSGSTYHNAQAIRYDDVITTGDPWDVTDAEQSGNVGDTVSPAVSVVTTVTNTLLVWAATNWAGGAWTPPTGFTERRDSGDQVCTVADKVQAAAGATGDITGTCAGSDKRTAWLGALMGIPGEGGEPESFGRPPRRLLQAVGRSTTW